VGKKKKKKKKKKMGGEKKKKPQKKPQKRGRDFSQRTHYRPKEKKTKGESGIGCTSSCRARERESGNLRGKKTKEKIMARMRGCIHDDGRRKKRGDLKEKGSPMTRSLCRNRGRLPSTRKKEKGNKKKTKKKKKKKKKKGEDNSPSNEEKNLLREKKSRHLRASWYIEKPPTGEER